MRHRPLPAGIIVRPSTGAIHERNSRQGLLDRIGMATRALRVSIGAGEIPEGGHALTADDARAAGSDSALMVRVAIQTRAGPMSYGPKCAKRAGMTAKRKRIASRTPAVRRVDAGQVDWVDEVRA